MSEVIELESAGSEEPVGFGDPYRGAHESPGRRPTTSLQRKNEHVQGLCGRCCALHSLTKGRSIAASVSRYLRLRAVWVWIPDHTS